MFSFYDIFVPLIMNPSNILVFSFLEIHDTVNPHYRTPLPTPALHAKFRSPKLPFSHNRIPSNLFLDCTLFQLCTKSKVILLELLYTSLLSFPK